MPLNTAKCCKNAGKFFPDVGRGLKRESSLGFGGGFL